MSCCSRRLSCRQRSSARKPKPIGIPATRPIELNHLTSRRSGGCEGKRGNWRLVRRSPSPHEKRSVTQLCVVDHVAERISQRPSCPKVVNHSQRHLVNRRGGKVVGEHGT